MESMGPVVANRLDLVVGADVEKGFEYMEAVLLEGTAAASRYEKSSDNESSDTLSSARASIP